MEKEVLSGYDQRRIESLTDPLLFSELVDMASEVCFGRALKFEAPQKSDNPEGGVIAQMGLRGLRAALDTDAYKDSINWDGLSTLEEEETPTFMNIITSPQKYSGELNREISENIRQFGQELLDTAYRCLGADVHEKLKGYCQASDDAQRIEVLEWVANRLRKMTRGGRGVGDGGNDGVYEPVRLSPRVIGVYPNHTVATTCLGVSVIAASFLEKAGAQHLHAGVARTSIHSGLSEEVDLVVNIEQAIGDDAPDEIKDAFLTCAYEALTFMQRDIGFHAANYVRLDKGWYQIDPNYNANTLIDGERDVVYLDGAYQDIDTFRSTAPGLERSVVMQYEKEIAISRRWMRVFDASVFDLEVVELMLVALEESIPAQIWPEVRAAIADSIPDSDEAGEFRQLYEALMVDNDLEDAFYRMFDKYVLWGNSIEDVAARMRDDVPYRHRIVEDLARLPALTVLSATLKFSSTTIPHPQHDTVEVGDPAHRVGTMVLQDFAMYYDDRLPPSFWLTHTSSFVPITETLDNAGRSPAQLELVLDTVGAHIGVGRFAYNSAYGIIYKFLAQNNEGNEEDAEG